MPSALATPIFYALLALPRPYGEVEAPEDRDARLARVAVAIDDASEGDDEMAAALVSFGWHESKFSARVEAMGPRKDTKGEAISLWSLHLVPSLAPWSEWRALGGEAGMPASAIVAARYLAWARGRCRSWQGAFSMLATGARCSWAGARQREWQRRRVLGWLRAAREAA